MKTRRHYVIPDVQVRPGDVVDHLDWIALDIVRRKPDVIVCIGDFWDFPSLSKYSSPGGLEKEGARIKADLDAGHAAMSRLIAPIQAEVERLERGHRARWKPRLIFTTGNHEDRIDRPSREDARFIGVLGSHLCEVERFGFERHGYKVPVEVDGVWYCHYWQSSHSDRPIGGTVDNRLNKLGFSFVQGHEQGLRYSNRPLPNGKTLHGLVAGSCYLGVEGYRGPQARNEWRGVVVLNDVRQGDMAIPMSLDLQYLCREYTGEELHDYLLKRYPDRDWSHFQ